MSEQQTVPQGAVVVGVDGSEKDDLAVDWAADDAARRGAALHVMYAFPWILSAREYGTAPSEEVRSMSQEVLDPAVGRARERRPGLEVSSAVVMEDAAEVLVGASGRASLVVLGARGLGRFAGAMLGSVSQKVTAHAESPVVVVRQAPVAGPVVVGVDRPEDSTEALEFAFAHAERAGAGVRVVHAVAPEGPRLEYLDARTKELLDEVAESAALDVQEDAEGWARRFPDVAVDVRQERRHPVEALVESARTASLLVVGSRGRRGLPGLRLGSVSRGVLHEAPVVAVVPIATT